MKKSIIITGLLALALGVTSVSGKDFELRSNMLKLNSELNEIQRGFILGDEVQINVALDTFSKNAEHLLSHKETMMKKLPEDMKNKKHKVNLSLKAARTIKYNVGTIREALANKEGLSIKKSRAKAQEAYLNIVNACFKCHNYVRDKKRLTAK